MTRLQPMRCRVTEPFTGRQDKPLVVKRGQRLSYERRKTEWAGWIWCSSSETGGGWVPESWARLNGTACVMERDYSSAELSARKGEALRVNFTESGWAWAVSSDGRTGWIPEQCLEPSGGAGPAGG